MLHKMGCDAICVQCGKPKIWAEMCEDNDICRDCDRDWRGEVSRAEETEVRHSWLKGEPVETQDGRHCCGKGMRMCESMDDSDLKEAMVFAEKQLYDAVDDERARCAAIARKYIVSDEDAQGHMPVNVAEEIAREIEGGE